MVLVCFLAHSADLSLLVSPPEVSFKVDLPLGVGLAWSLRRNFETFLDLFIPAAVHNLAFFSVLIEASFCEGCLTDFGVHGLAVLRGLVVAYLALDVMALLGSLNSALLAARLVALLLLLR